MIWNSKWHRQFSFSLPLLFPLNLPVLPNRKWAGKKGKERKKKKKKKQCKLKLAHEITSHAIVLFHFSSSHVCASSLAALTCAQFALLRPSSHQTLNPDSISQVRLVRTMWSWLAFYLSISYSTRETSLRLPVSSCMVHACVHDEDGNWHDWYGIPLTSLRSEEKSLLDQQLDLIYEHVS